MDKRLYERRMEVLREKEREMIEKTGWLHHAVFSDDGVHANYHTHGIFENFGHLDFQVVLPIDSRIVHSIYHDLVERIKQGETFEAGVRYSEVIRNFDVMFEEFTECGRPVLRLLLPDPNGLLPNEEGCEEIYTTQLDVIEEEDEDAQEDLH